MVQRTAKRFLMLVGVALLACKISAPGTAQEGIPWIDNYQEALRQAKATGKPIFLEFRCEA